MLIDAYGDGSCSVVRLELIVTVEDDEGQTTETRTSKRLRVRGSTPTTVKFRHHVGKGRRVVAQRLEQTSCQPCD